MFSRLADDLPTNKSFCNLANGHEFHPKKHKTLLITCWGYSCMRRCICKCNIACMCMCEYITLRKVGGGLVDPPCSRTSLSSSMECLCVLSSSDLMRESISLRASLRSSSSFLTAKESKGKAKPRKVKFPQGCILKAKQSKAHQ